MADDTQRPIIIRRKKVGHGGHHGGVWKIAYADFVTAMMAFFLLMWLLGSVSKGDLAGIAEYFKNPMRVSLSGGTGTGESTSLIKMGGGQDLTRTDGQFKRGHPEQERTLSIKAARAELERQEAGRLQELKGRLEALIDANPVLKPFKHQLLLDISSEGLRIQVVDEKNRPMFAIGKAELQPYTREILREIARLLNEVPNRVSLAGHTDATPYVGGEKGYSNWELSADRANASRRELVAGGLSEGKVMRTVGLASSVLYDKSDPLNPTNRRISIVVLNKRTEEAISQDGRIVEVQNADDISPSDISAAQPAPGPGR